MLFFGKKNKIEKEKPDWIVVGLGNPGDKYKNTRPVSYTHLTLPTIYSV